MRIIKIQSPIVEVFSLQKVFGQKTVLDIDQLTLNSGHIYGVIGPSGAGKSTLLRIMNLITEPSGGSYHFMGHSMRDLGNRRLHFQRKMALVFQKTVLFRTSVAHNVAYGLKVRGVSKNVMEERVETLLDQVGMRDLAHQRADTLSGGEAQRVAIARALAFQPELLLLDEPTANLDPLNIELIETVIKNMSASTGMTVLMVTHNVFQARRIADSVIFMDQGSIVEMGTSQEIFEAPLHEKTHNFVQGKMIY